MCSYRKKLGRAYQRFIKILGYKRQGIKLRSSFGKLSLRWHRLPRRMILYAIGFLIGSQHAIIAAPLFIDNFSGNIVDPNRWHIPTWTSDDDGTFVGRTQFRCTQNSSLPAVVKGNAIITVETFNPTGFSFYGTDLISNPSFSIENGIHIKVKAKMNTTTSGIVGGIFLYGLNSNNTTLHDEIDFEILTNHPDKVQTNLYHNEVLGAGHPQFTSYEMGTITDYHIYEIKWLPSG